MARHLSCARLELLMKTEGRHDLSFTRSDLEQEEHPGFRISKTLKLSGVLNDSQVVDCHETGAVHCRYVL